MDPSTAGRTCRPRLRPLARCLGLALAFTGTLAAAPIRPVAEHAAIGEWLPDWRTALPPSQGLDRTAATIKLYPALQLAPRRISEHPAGSIPVTNCDDSGAGSLRDAIGAAVNGQTIDLTATGCSTITLTTGDIAITQENLILQGPGASYLTIDGNNLFSLRHYNAAGGTFGVYDLAIAHGRRSLDGAVNLSATGGASIRTARFRFRMRR